MKGLAKWVLGIGLLANLALAGEETQRQEEYVSKEILFLPWGDGKGKIGLRVIKSLVQGIATETSRYGATKIEVDKDGNIYIWDDVAYPPDTNERIIKKPKSNKILKFVKEKKNRKETGEYKYVESIPLTLKGLTIEKKPFKVEKFESKYRYEVYIMNKEEAEKEIKPYRCGLEVIDVNTGKEVVKIDYQGLEDGFTEYAIPLGNDAKGNVYVLIDDTDIRSAPFILEVHKYNIEGNLLAKVGLSMDDFGWTDRFNGQRNRVAIDKDGNIYQLLAKKDGVHLIKWEVK